MHLLALKIYKTNFDYLIKSVFKGFTQSFIGPWSNRSLGLMSVLFGFYFASTITAYYLEEYHQRVVVVAFLFSFNVSALEFSNKFTQGAFILAKTDPGAKVKIDKTSPPKK